MARLAGFAISVAMAIGADPSHAASSVTYVAGPTAYTPNGTVVAPGNLAPVGLSFSVKAAQPGDCVYKIEVREVAGTSYSLVAKKSYTVPKDPPDNTLRVENMASGLGVGTHVLYLHTMTFTDAIQEDSGKVTVVITSSAPPTVSLSSPADGATVIATGSQTNVLVAGTAASSGGAVTETDVLVDGNKYAALTGAAATSISTTVALAPGAHTIALRAYNAPSVFAVSNVASIFVDQAPTASLSAPATGALYPWTPGGVYIPISGFAIEPDSGDTISKAEVLVNSVAQAPLTGFTPSSITSAFLAPAPGTYQLQLRVTDSHGAVGISNAATVVVNALPVVALASPANGAIYQTTAGGSYAVPVSGTATDSDGSILTTQLLVDGQVVTSVGGGGMSTSYTVAAGSHTFQLKATDDRYQSTFGPVATILVNQPPSINMSTPTSGVVAWLGGSVAIHIAGGAVDPDSGDAISRTEVLVNGVAQPPMDASNLTSISTSYVVSAAGSYQIQLRATDSRGGVSVSNAATVVLNALPVVGMSAPANGAVFQTSAGGSYAVPVTGSATDSDGTIANTQLLVDGAVVSTIGGGSVSTSYTVAAGSHTFQLKATDSQGQATFAGVATVYVNQPPTVTMTAPVAKVLGWAGVGVPIAITGNASDPDSGDSVARTEVLVNGAAQSALTGAAAAAINTSYTATAAGTYTIQLRTTDARGGVSLSNSAAVVLNVPPAVSMTAPLAGATYQTATGAKYPVPVTGNATDSDGTVASIQLLVDGTPVTSVAAASISTTYATAAGSHTFQLKATDNQGQVSVGGVVSVFVNQPPAVTINPPAATPLGLSGASVSIPISGSTADPDSGDAISKTEVVVNGVSVSTLTGAGATTVNTAYTATSARTYQIQLRSTDSHGGVTLSSAINVVVEAAPVATLISPANGSTLPDGPDGTATLSVSGSATDSDGTVANMQVFVDGISVATSTGATIATAYATTPGVHAVKVRAFDNLGVYGDSAVAQVTVIAAYIPVAIAPPLLAAPDAGTLPGGIAVGMTGAATYSIPIEIPPGSGGMQPEVALAYSSQGGNGPMGVGWTLTGMSTIHRCTKTIAQDGAPGRIRFDNGDRLCLNDERLMRSNGANPGTDVNAIDAAYWASGGEYHTEHENFARVTAITNGFKVEHKSGHVEFYGTQTTGVIVAQGRSDGAALAWPLARVEDKSGNYLLVQYTQNVVAGTGEYVPSQILYGGNSVAATLPDLAVRFDYEPRPDPQVMYIGGSRNDLRSRLIDVKTYSGVASDGTGGTLARSYIVSYLASVSSARSLVSTIQGCAVNPVSGVNECLPKTTFEWGQQSIDLAAGTPFIEPLSNPGAVVDFDGDGVNDYVTLAQHSYCSPDPSCIPADENQILSQLDGTFTMTPFVGGTATTYSMSFAGSAFPAGLTSAEFADLNGDGKPDIILVRNSGAVSTLWAYCLNDGTTTFNCISFPTTSAGHPSNLRGHEIVDLLNEHREHVLLGIDKHFWLDSGNVMQSQAIDAVNVTPTFKNFQNPLIYPSFHPVAIDFSARDLSDFYATLEAPVGPGITSPPAVSSCLSRPPVTAGTLRYECQMIYAGVATIQSAQSVGDLNGDGLTDFVFWEAGGNIIACLSTEISADCKDSGVATKIPGASGAAQVYVGDLTGDGSDGLLLLTTTTSNGPADTAKYCRLDINQHLQCKSLTFPAPVGYVLGDARIVSAAQIPALIFSLKSDIHVGSAGIHDTPYSLATSPAQDRIKAVVNGLGAREEVDYARGDDPAAIRRYQLINGVEQRPVYPLVVSSPGVVAKELRTMNGQGGWLKTDYHYEGAAGNAQGRGGAGFAVRRSTDLQSGVGTTAYLRQDFPFTGMVSRTTVVAANGSVLSDSSIALNSQPITTLPASGSTVFVYAAVTTTSKRDLDNSAVSTTSETATYGDGWGNLTRKVTQTIEPGDATKRYTSTVDMTYLNVRTASAWFGGRTLIMSETRSGIDGVASAVRDAMHTYDLNTGLVLTDQQSPSNAAFKFTNTYDRSGNKFGLVNKITQTWIDPYTAASISRLTRDVDFDPRGRFPLSDRNALGQQQSQTFYATTGAHATSKDLNGLITSWTADGFGRVSKEVRPDKTEMRHYLKQCDASCPAKATTADISDQFNGSARTHVPTIVYRDSMDNVLRTATWGHDGTAIVQDSRYDPFGRVYEIDQPRFLTGAAYLQERRGYDDLSRVTSVTTRREDGTEVSATTQFKGPVRILTNAKNQIRTDYRDALGRVVKVTNTTSKGDVATQFVYTAFGDLAQTIDPNQNVITVSFDALGRKTDLRDPDLGWIHFDIDPVGRSWRQVNPLQRTAGTNTRTQFDALDRQVARFEPDLESHWIFDTATTGVGKLAETFTGTATAKDYRRQFAYDSLARSSTTTTTLAGIDYKSTPGYDGWGRQTSDTEQHGTDAAKVFTRRYNAQGDLSAIAHNGIDLWSVTTKDASMRFVAEQLGNGLIQTSHFNSYSARKDDVLVQVGAAGIKRFHENDSYDPLGNVLVRSGEYSYGQPDAAAYKDTFGYDDLNRLTSDQEWSNAAKNYSYDSAGNLLTKNDPSASPALVATYSYPAQGANAVRPHAVSSITGWPGTFRYDANGNELGSPTGLAVTWTSFDMPIRISRTVGQATNYDTFVYGSDHQRTKMTTGVGVGVTSITYYANALEVQTDASGQVTQVKTYWPMGLGLDIDKPSTPTSMIWMHRDRLDSVMALTDAAGTLVEKLDYDAWGKRRYANGIGTDDSIKGVLNDKGFTGQQMLDNVELVHLNGRVYDPLVGRFLSGDPFVQDAHNGQNYNRYTYVLNNPTNLTDPTGYTWMEWVPVAGSVMAFGEMIEGGHFVAAGAFGAMAVFDGATLGLGSMLDAPLKAAVKVAIEREIKAQAEKAIAKEIAEQAALNTVIAAKQAAKKNAEKAAGKAEGEAAKRAESAGPAAERAETKNAGKNKNSNDAEGNFGVYEITIDGKKYKVGKADLDRITKSSGDPTRLHQQLRKLREAHPESEIKGTVVEGGHATTAEAKLAENRRIQEHLDQTGEVLEGNAKSFKERKIPEVPKKEGRNSD
jgi:RHS repeat-associated protein